MTATISGSNGITFPNASVQAVAATGFGFKNRIINGGFIINQRAYVSGTALASGVYAHDRYKAGSGGCTYTFTQGSSGVNTTVTITAGTLQQVVEGCNMPEGGTYVLSWTGSAQARFNGGSYSASPLAVTGITAGANVTIEFNTGTVGSVQLETGVTATSFDVRDYGRELILCQRYYEVLSATYVNASFGATLLCTYFAASANYAAWYFKQPKRAIPTIAIISPATWSAGTPSGIYIAVDNVQFNSTAASNYVTTTVPNTNVIYASAEL